MFTYLGQMRAQTSRLVTHQIIEAKVKTQIHKHVFQGNWTLTLKGLAHVVEESYTHINITKKIPISNIQPNIDTTWKVDDPHNKIYNFYLHPHNAYKNHI
jgi:hypothetical protein